MLQSLHNLGGPLLDPSHLSCTGEPSTGHSTPGVASTVLDRGEASTSFNLLATLLLPQPGIPLVFFVARVYYWFMFQRGVHQELQLLFCKVAFQLTGPQNILLLRVAPTKVQDFTELHEFLINPFFLLRPLWIATWPSRVSATSPSSVSSADLLKVHSVPSSKLLMKMLNRTGPSIDPQGTLLVTDLQLDFVFCEIFIDKLMKCRLDKTMRWITNWQAQSVVINGTVSKPYWHLGRLYLLLSFMCLEMVSRISCSIAFAGIEVRLNSLDFPRSSPFAQPNIVWNTALS